MKLPKQGSNESFEQMSETVHSDPYIELPIRSEKYAQNCSELLLSGRNISHLRNFESFVNLESLWLNNNRILVLDGLDSNFRLKYLYLHENKLQTLEDCSLELLTNIKQLTLNNNCLDNLDGTIFELKKLRNMTHLDLFGNPISQEDNYRLRVIGDLEYLDVFDRQKVTDEERVHAHKLKLKLAKLNSFSLDGNHKNNSDDLPQEHPLMAGILERVRFELSRTRTYLEREFDLLDKRHLGQISEKLFCQVLGQFGILCILSDEETEVLLDKYRGPMEITSISKTGTLPRNGINYFRFCNDVVPYALQTLPRAFAVEEAPEVSVTAQDLQHFVKTIGLKKKREDAIWKQQTMLAARSSSTASLNATSSSSNNSSKSSLLQTEAANGLSPWLMGELNKLLQDMEKHSASSSSHNSTATPGKDKEHGKDREISKEDVVHLFKQMMALGKIPTMGLAAARDGLIGLADTSAVSMTVLRRALGCERAVAVAASTAGPGTGSKSPAKSIASPVPGGGGSFKNFSRNASSTSNGSASAPFTIAFRDMNLEETDRLQTKMFHTAGEQMETLLRVSGKEDTSALALQTMRGAINGTRLASHITKQPNVAVNPLPEQVMATAPNRADIIVLPNLFSPSKARPATHQGTPGQTSHSAAAAGIVDDDEFDVADWRLHFMNLGMKGEMLSMALERKENSWNVGLRQKRENNATTPQRAQTALPPCNTSPMRSSSGNNGMSPKRERCNTTTTTPSKLTTPHKSSIPPIFTPTKGWNPTTTGTIVIG